MKQALILASSSVYRRELLQRLQINFSTVSPHVDEAVIENEAPKDTAIRLAIDKAQKVGTEYQHALIIGCDQVATLDGVQLGKPLNHQNATKQLQKMRGKTVSFYTGLCLLNAETGRLQSDVATYEVTFRALNDDQIENYLAKEQPYHCAGSAKSEGLGICLMESMVGDDPNALIGLPLIKLITMLQNEGINII